MEIRKLLSKVRTRMNTEITVAVEDLVRRHPCLPADPLRQAALVCEEAGEALQAALDLTRVRPITTVVELLETRAARDVARAQLRQEIAHVMAMAIVVLAAMVQEEVERDDSSDSGHTGRTMGIRS